MRGVRVVIAIFISLLIILVYTNSTINLDNNYNISNSNSNKFSNELKTSYFGWSRTEVLTENSVNNSHNPVIAIDKFDNVYVVWEDNTVYNSSGMDVDIYYKVWNYTTKTWMPLQLISTESTNDSGEPDIVFDNDGNLHVVWCDFTDYNGAGTDVDVFYKFWNASTNTWTSTEVVSTESTSWSIRPAVDIDDDGNVHVTWEDFTNYGGAGTDIDIFYKKKVFSTQTWTTTTVISSESYIESRRPDIVANGSGDVHIAWQDPTPYDGAGSDWDIFYKFWNKSTSSWTTTQVLSTGSTWECGFVSLTIDRDGNVYLSYHEDADEDTDIYYQFWNASTNTWSSKTKVSTQSNADAWYPSISLDSSGNVHIAWRDDTNYDGAGIDPDIFYKYWNKSSGTWTTTEVVSTESNNESYYPKIALDSHDNIYITWEDKSEYSGAGSDTDVFFKKKANFFPPEPFSLSSNAGYTYNQSITEINGSITKVDSGITEFYYTISGLNSNSYFYVVLARNITGNTMSNCIRIEVDRNPGSFTLSSDAGSPDIDGTFNLTWNVSKGADNYSVYTHNNYISEINGSVTKLDEGITNLNYSIINLPTGVYYYKVVSFNETGKRLSNCIPVIVNLPPDPFNLSSDAGNPDIDGTFNLIWNTSLYADNYTVFTHSNFITEINGSVTKLNEGITDLNYSINGLKTGDYYYIIVAYNEIGNESSNCIYINVKIPPGFFSLSSNAGTPDTDGMFNLTWTASAGADNYSLYGYDNYITEINGSLTELDNGLTNYSYAISGLVPDDYYYILVAFNETGNTTSNCLHISVKELRRIVIDGDATGVGAKNWTWAVKQDWCSGGSGTWNDPFIIENLILNGQDSWSCILIRDSNEYFIIRNCTLYNSASYTTNWNAGIKLRYTTRGRIINCNLSNNRGYGIFFDYSDNNTVINCMISHNDDGAARYYYGDRNSVINCTIHNNDGGLFIYDSDKNKVIDCKIYLNKYDGVHFLKDCAKNIVSGNNIYNNTRAGVYFRFFSIASPSNNLIINNNITNNGVDGIYLIAGVYNDIINNTISFNGRHGIFYNSKPPRQFTGSRIIGNRILNNTNIGIFFNDSCFNYVYNCTFIGNSINAMDNGMKFIWNGTSYYNMWMNETLQLGNFWDDYDGYDNNGDGIGDTPYFPQGSSPTNDSYPVCHRSDNDAPVITIISPTTGELFGSIALDFNISISEYMLNTTWYTLDEGATNITFIGTTGTISQSLWNAIGNGTVTLIFYANDSFGNIGSAQVIIRKDVLSPTITILSPLPFTNYNFTAPGYNLIITECNLNSTWYTLDFGLTNYTFTGLTGTINQSAWDALPEGLVRIIFFANDTIGNLGSQNILIIKDLPGPGNFTAITDADNPDIDGTFNINWTISAGADNYSIYWYNRIIISINGSLTLIDKGLTNNSYEISALVDGTYYFAVVAYNKTGWTLSNNLIVIVERKIVGDDDDDDDDGTQAPNLLDFLLNPLGIAMMGSVVAIAVIGIIVASKKKGRAKLPKEVRKLLKESDTSDKLVEFEESEPTEDLELIKFEESEPTEDLELIKFEESEPTEGLELKEFEESEPTEFIPKPSEIEMLEQEILSVKEDILIIEKKFAENLISTENYIEIKAELYEKLGELEERLSILKEE